MATYLPLLVLLLFCTPRAADSDAGDHLATKQDLATCLSSAGVNNYTIRPAELCSDATFSYNRLLNFSIQNLRFARSSVAKPAAVILPGSKMELRSSVLCLRASKLAIRVRSGGHSYEGLSYSAENGTPFAVVDLMNLNGVRVDPVCRTAWVEAGATLGEFYHAVAKFSNGTLAFSAGSCPTVGSGGHIAGGGFGLLSRKFGLAADNVLDAVLIDSAGRVLDRAAMGEDVFWAIRGGGGGNWGAVYAWKVRLSPIPDRVAAFIVNLPGPTRLISELVDEWQRVAPSLPDEFFLSAFVGARLPESTREGMSVTFKGLYLGAKSKAVEILAELFPGIGLSDPDVEEMSWIQSVVRFSGLPKGSTVSDLKSRALQAKTFFKAKSDYVRARISKPALISALDLLSQEPRAYLILDPYGGAMDRVGSDHLPFPHRGGNLYAIQYLIEWTAEDDGESERYMDWIRRFYEYMEGHVSKGPRAAYVNYLDLDLGSRERTAATDWRRNPAEEARAWGEKYFLGNYERLIRAKTAVDPDNVFNHEQSIPPDKGTALGVIRKDPNSPTVSALQRIMGMCEGANVNVNHATCPNNGCVEYRAVDDDVLI
ncbi:berberine bridge enzyme-like D-2 [Typha angustifolia]|uniref:berberine bridge enzyme-like D-2 n=1 Tax=Typha angustifolia TaxID=59011 RepID=UPI003C2C06CA